MEELQARSTPSLEEALCCPFPVSSIPGVESTAHMHHHLFLGPQLIWTCQVCQVFLFDLPVFLVTALNVVKDL